MDNWIYYGFSGAIANLIDIVWISHFFAVFTLVVYVVADFI